MIYCIVGCLILGAIVYHLYNNRNGAYDYRVYRVSDMKELYRTENIYKALEYCRKNKHIRYVILRRVWKDGYVVLNPDEIKNVISTAKP